MDYFWAKTTTDGSPGISVRDHCLNVGCVAEALLQGSSSGICRETIPQSWITWLAACHDIGKISAGFQSKCAAWMHRFRDADAVRRLDWPARLTDDRCNHARVAQYTMQHVLHDRFGASKATAALWAAVSGMHHGSPHYLGRWNPCELHLGGESAAWEALRVELAEHLAKILGEPILPPFDVVEDNSPLWWTAGLISVADWIGSDEEFYSPEAKPEPGAAITAKAAALRALASIGLGPLPELPELSFSELFGFPANDLQEQAIAAITGPGVYVIEAPMGMGKTEAALAAAYTLMRKGKAGGFYFALPTQATSNRIHLRVAAFLEKLGPLFPRLIHSGSWLVDPALRFPKYAPGAQGDGGRDSRDWFASGKRALLAPFGVGTVDQALLAVIPQRHFFVRHYALAGKIVIIDEVHSYDVFTGTLVEALVETLTRLGCTVIILSATLTRERRDALLRKAGGQEAVPGDDRFPLISSSVRPPVSVTPPLKKPPVRIAFRPEAVCLGAAVASVRAGARVLWVCNTVDKAQAVYHAICGERCEGDPPIGLLHARFTFADRERLENEWMTRLGKERQPAAGGCLLVATQIVEQSVDLDADLLITELAPTDLLFQRMGRLWRHWKEGDCRCRAEPETWIVAEPLTLPEFRVSDERAILEALGKKAKVYAPYVLLRTLEHWHAQPCVHLPDDIRPWLEATYAMENRSDPPGWLMLLERMRVEKTSHLNQAQTATNLWQPVSSEAEEGSGTRLNTCPSVPLVLLREINREGIVLCDGTAVPVREFEFDYATAKVMHRNLVKAPRWWFAQMESALDHLDRPVANTLKGHVRGKFEAALLDGLKVRAASLGDAAVEYSPVFGLVKVATTSGRACRYEFEDEEVYDL